MSIVLITGGSGLVGSTLTHQLLEKGYEVRHLSRTPSEAIEGVTTYTWDVQAQNIDQQALEGVNHLIHLAGANINKRWTRSYKQQIRDSRVKGTQLLTQTLSQTSHQIKTAVCASAVGIYGDRGEDWLTEDSKPAYDFLGQTCQEWESAHHQFKELGIRTVILRSGVALTKRGGALPSMAFPVKLGIGAPLGSGKQYVPWIHLDDLCQLYLKALEDNRMEGTYNASAPHPVTNKKLTKKLGEYLHRPVFLPPIPSFILQLIVGEMSNIILYSTRPSAQKVQASSYTFQYPDIDSALRAIYQN